MARAAPATTWKIGSLGTEDCVANTAHEYVTGDDRGGIAAGNERFFYASDDNTGGFNYGDPRIIETLVADRVGIFSDLGTGKVYSLTNGGDPWVDCQVTADGFVELDPLDLSVTGTVVPLSSSITLPSCAGSIGGMFAGLGMVIVYNGTNAFEITLADGTVTDLGAKDLGDAETCEEWAFWGMAERFGGETYVVYRQTEVGDSIIRRSLDDDETEVILDLAALEDTTSGDASDMCSIAINPALGKWVYHAEDLEGLLGSVFEGSGPGEVSDVEEVVGVCPATFESPAN